MVTPRNRLLYLITGLLIGANRLAAQADCKLVLDAMSKIAKTPTHLYVTMNMNGKPQDVESIYTASVIYVKVNGAWSVSPLTPAEMLQQQQKTIQNSQSTCAYVRDEAVGGVMAARYKAHTETPRTTSDTETWISKASGLPLRSVTEMNGGKIRTSTRYEYRDVKPPI